MKTLTLAVAALAAIAWMPASAQDRSAYTPLTAAIGMMAASPRTPAPTGQPAYLGLYVDPGPRATVAAVDPGSPAEAAGLRPGDMIEFVATSGFFGKVVRFQKQEDVDAWLAQQRPGATWEFATYRGGVARNGKFTLAAGIPGAPEGRRASAAGAGAVEEARAAYQQMCARGQERLSAATCEGMRRDLEQAMANQAAARREAEVMGVYRQLCSPGREKLSKETCASMLEEAKQTLAAAPPVAPPPAAKTPAAKTPVAKAPARPAAKAAIKPAAAPKSAYDELCQPGRQQVSAETCAALKADAGR